MENFLIDFDIEFENQDLNFYIKNLKSCFNANNKNFVQLCFVITKIYNICKEDFFKAKDNEYYNASLLLGKFGFDKKAISRYKNCFARFCKGDLLSNVSIIEDFKYFSPSKLFELLPLDEKLLSYVIENNIVNQDMTVKEIRQLVKSQMGLASTEVINKLENSSEIINEEEIPMVYDPEKKYDYEYFKSKSKNQLLNIVWDLQKKYQLLKNKNLKK